MIEMGYMRNILITCPLKVDSVPGYRGPWSCAPNAGVGLVPATKPVLAEWLSRVIVWQKAGASVKENLGGKSTEETKTWPW